MQIVERLQSPHPRPGQTDICVEQVDGGDLLLFILDRADTGSLARFRQCTIGDLQLAVRDIDPAHGGAHFTLDLLFEIARSRYGLVAPGLGLAHAAGRLEAIEQPPRQGGADGPALSLTVERATAVEL